MGWFDVDREGLAKLLERRGKGWVLAELLQNAWDAPGATSVSLTLEPVPGRPLADLVIVDDSPTGFADISHAFTLFGESVKRSDPTLRGRFNLGEKMVLALCDRAEITSTTGRVVFEGDSRREFPRTRRPSGTEFRALVRMTRAEINAALGMAAGFIAPPGIVTVINGETLAPRRPLRTFDWRLETEIADEGGVLRRGTRKTSVSVYEPLPGRPARIYELGIPIVETGDRYDVDIGQKVPLSLERDSVTPGYLRDVRVGVLNHVADLVTGEEAAGPWVGDALEDGDVSPEAVEAVVRSRFGDKVVSYDPSDREANSRAVAAGYTVIPGRAFSSRQWDGVRASGFVRPAGQVTPTPKPFDPDGDPAEHVEKTPAMQAFEGFCKEMARRLLGVEISVAFLERFNALAAYGGRRMSFNVGRLGKKWFEGPLQSRQLDLVIHELGHETASNHFSREYNDALTKLGADATLLALSHPHLFDLSRYGHEAAPREDAMPDFDALAVDLLERVEGKLDETGEFHLVAESFADDTAARQLRAMLEGEVDADADLVAAVSGLLQELEEAEVLNGPTHEAYAEAAGRVAIERLRGELEVPAPSP